VLIVWKGEEGAEISVYDSSGSKLFEKRGGRLRILVQGSRRVELVPGFTSPGLVVDYDTKPCIEERGSTIMVRECGARGGEE